MQFDQHKTENENVSELTKTLASVTVEKAKVKLICMCVVLIKSMGLIGMEIIMYND